MSSRKFSCPIPSAANVPWIKVHRMQTDIHLSNECIRVSHLHCSSFSPDKEYKRQHISFPDRKGSLVVSQTYIVVTYHFLPTTSKPKCPTSSSSHTLARGSCREGSVALSVLLTASMSTVTLPFSATTLS